MEFERVCLGGGGLEEMPTVKEMSETGRERGVEASRSRSISRKKGYKQATSRMDLNGWKSESIAVCSYRSLSVWLMDRAGPSAM